MSESGDASVGSSPKEKGPVSRETLYERVCSEPMTKVAATYGISSSYLARVCRLMNVPKPERGYWARVAAGHTPQKPPLPEAKPGDERMWARHWWELHPQPMEPVPPVLKRRRRIPMGSLPTMHGMISGAKELFDVGEKSREVGYIKPFKRNLVDLLVTSATTEKALALANGLFLELEARHHPVVLAAQSEGLHRVSTDWRISPTHRRYESENLWCPARCTVTYIGTVAIGLTILETAEELEVRYVNGKYIPIKDLPPNRSRWDTGATWTAHQDFPTGRLLLHAYSPYPGTKWSRTWHETAGRELGPQVRSIAKALESAAVPIALEAEEARKQAEIEHRQWLEQQAQWRREEEERRKAAALKQSKAELLQIIAGWGEANRIAQFFRDAQQRALEMDESSRETLLDRLGAAQKMVGTVDALAWFSRWRSPEERVTAAPSWV